MRDLTFKIEEGRFNLRVGAIIIHNSKVLMVKNTRDPYYYSVGGRVKFNETGEEAIEREVFEETGLHLEIERLAYIHENFFEYGVTNEKFHELSFFYLMKSKGELDEICMSFTEDGAKEKLYWLDLDKLQSEFLYPDFFKTELGNITEEVKSFLTKDCSDSSKL